MVNLILMKCVHVLKPFVDALCGQVDHDREASVLQHLIYGIQQHFAPLATSVSLFPHPHPSFSLTLVAE